MISLCVAEDKNGIIGDSEGKCGIPFRCNVDLFMFRRLSWGSHVIVGRKTWEKLPTSVKKCRGRVWNIVTSEVKSGIHDISEYPYKLGGIKECRSHLNIKSMMNHHIVIAGGASIYRQALEADLVDHIFLTKIPYETAGDIEWCGIPDNWKKVKDDTVPLTIKYKQDVSNANYLENDDRWLKNMPAKISFQEWVKQ